MEEGSLHPSVMLKIQAHSFLNISKPQISTPGKCNAIAYAERSLHSLPFGGKYSAVSYVKGSLYSLHPASQGSASASITPTSPVCVGAPSELGSNALFTILSITSIMAAAPIQRVKLLMQCQNEIIKTGRLFHTYKGIADCFARTVKNEGIISMWRGSSINIIAYCSYKVIQYTVLLSMLQYLNRALNFKNDKDDYWKWFAANSLCGGVVMLSNYPLEYAYVRLATDVVKTDGNVYKRQFNGLIDVWRKTLKTDGVVGLYRGYSIQFVSLYLLNNTLMLGMQAGLKSHLPGVVELQHGSKIIGSVLEFGLETCTQLVTHPLDTVHCRMMMRSGEAVKYKNSLNAFSQILKTEGIGSLYKGASAIVLRNAFIQSIVLAVRVFLTN